MTRTSTSTITIDALADAFGDDQFMSEWQWMPPLARAAAILGMAMDADPEGDFTKIAGAQYDREMEAVVAVDGRPRAHDQIILGSEWWRWRGRRLVTAMQREAVAA